MRITPKPMPWIQALTLKWICNKDEWLMSLTTHKQLTQIKVEKNEKTMEEINAKITKWEKINSKRKCEEWEMKGQ